MVIIGIVLLMAIVYVLLKSFSYTPAINGQNVIASLETVTIGGEKQSVLIRSQDTRNPILLYLHSGPGSTEMVAFRSYNPELEKHFTVVIWEQRGTGKSYDSSMEQTHLTIDRLVEDTGELMQFLLERFHQNKLFLLGHSWGSALGILTAQKYPQYLYAYAGSGQEVDPAEGEKVSWEYAYTAATKAGNTEATRELANINQTNPYLTISNNPKWYDELKAERKWLVKFGGEAYEKDNCNFFINPALGLSEYTIGDFIKFAQGSEYSLKALWPQVMEINFLKTATDIKVPVFFLQGRHDFNAPSSLVEEYYSQMNAPSKELIWFENSGHHPMYEEPDTYDKILAEKLLPLASFK
ncbi:MAG: alpha/beta hydrolase [Eubacteriales bacterium]